MKKASKMSLPPIGLRIVKSAVAVALCYVVSFVRGNSGIVFYSQLAALWCMQVYVSNTKQNAIQRTIGTVVGALYGLVFLLGKARIGLTGDLERVTDAAVISLMILIILYTTVLLKKKQASYFSCVVFLSIVVNHMTDANPYLFVWNRFLDTMIGIAIGIGVNCFSLPKEKRKDVLFVSGLDDTLLNRQELLSDYNKVELNRMLDEGIHFTVSTMRTPASLMDPLQGIRLNLPVIAMNGAVLYDIREKKYLKSYIISPESAGKLLHLMHGQGLHCFSNVLVDDMLVIYYDETEDAVQRRLVQELRKSPYRNYVNRPVPETEAVVYFMLLYPREVIEEFYKVLEREDILLYYKVLKYDSTDYPGYAYIKIYNRNASREHMIRYLQQALGIQKTVTFGSIPGKYDVPVEDSDTGSMLHTLKRLYEPVKRPWKREDASVGQQSRDGV